MQSTEREAGCGALFVAADLELSMTTAPGFVPLGFARVADYGTSISTVVGCMVLLSAEVTWTSLRVLMAWVRDQASSIETLVAVKALGRASMGLILLWGSTRCRLE
jgi:hypothetical protein